MKWAIELILRNNFEIEHRVAKILAYLSSQNNSLNCVVRNFEGTGPLGNKLTQENNEIKVIDIEISKLINIFLEGGQVFDMILEILTENERYKIKIIRGDEVEISGDGYILPEEVLGDNKSV